MKELIPNEAIEKRIFLIRGRKVMLDRDLADLFGVETKHLNRQVKRNIQRFPNEFMFRLNKRERDELVPIWHQFEKMKHSYALPYAFSEHGVAMFKLMPLSSFSLRGDFAFRFAQGRQRSLVFLAPAELSRPALAEAASDILGVPVLSLRSTGIPKNTRAALPKISIRSKLSSGIYG